MALSIAAGFAAVRVCLGRKMDFDGFAVTYSRKSDRYGDAVSVLAARMDSVELGTGRSDFGVFPDDFVFRTCHRRDHAISVAFGRERLARFDHRRQWVSTGDDFDRRDC